MDADDIAPTGSQEQFAAALTAKLDSLTDAGVSSSPDIGDYENPDSMETQGDALCAGSGTQSPLGSISEFDLTNSPNSLPIPDCDPDSQFTSALLPTYGPLPDPAADPIFDDSMMIGPLFNENGGDCQAKMKYLLKNFCSIFPIIKIPKLQLLIVFVDILK